MVFLHSVKNICNFRKIISYSKCVSLFSRQFSGSMQNFPGKQIFIGNQPIHYEQSGSGKHILVLLPGALGSSQSDFIPQLQKLDGTKFTVIAWDPPGYGYSRPPERTFPPNFLHRDAEMCAKFLETLGHNKYSLLGWSDGATTGIIMAARNTKNVEKLVIWGGSTYVIKEDAVKSEATRDIKTWSERMKAPMIKMYGETHFQKLWSNYLDAYTAFYKNKDGSICREDIDKVVCPTFILHGDKDPMLAKEHPDYLKSSIKNSRLHRFADGKHNIHLRYADEFNKLVTDFLLEK